MGLPRIFLKFVYLFDHATWPVGPSSLTRDQNCTLSGENKESQPPDHQGTTPSVNDKTKTFALGYVKLIFSSS